MSVIAQLSAQVDADTLGRKADLLVTETFGTMLLGEGVLRFVSDASTSTCVLGIPFCCWKFAITSPASNFSAKLFVTRDQRQGDRLLKEGGEIIPAGGCQYVTLVQMSEPLWSPPSWRGFNLSRLEDLQDTVYWKAMFLSKLRSASKGCCNM